jgi:hypothetical protein
VNFFDSIKIEIANKNDQIPQIAPLIGLEGNINPIDL